MTLYLFRHGQTDWNKAHRFQGRVDIPLNEMGRDLARMTAQKWPVVAYDKVYISPLQRAQETAAIVLKGRPEWDICQTDERLTEFCFGKCEGLNIDIAGQDPASPMYNLLHDPVHYQPDEEAESFDDLITRARDFLTHEILPLEAKGVHHILVVAHGALIRGLVCAAGLKTVANFWAVPYYNCCLTTLDVTEGRITMVREAEVFYDHTGSFGGWVNH